jgi:DNA repair protein RecO (recombination protein O)
MEERGSGIILRTRPLTETSLIVQWLTEDLGRIATVAKGARRPKSIFLGRIDLFYEGQFSFIRSRKSELHTLKEVVLEQTHPELRRDLVALGIASYLAVLIEHATETETPVPEIWALFREALHQLSNRPADAMILFKFESRLLALLGFAPPLEKSRLSLPAKSLLTAFMAGEEAAKAENLSVMKESNRFLQASIGTALERVPPQRLGLARLLGL